MLLSAKKKNIEVDEENAGSVKCCKFSELYTKPEIKANFLH